MNEASRQSHLEQFRPLFSHLTPQDVEQFYAIYQRWSLYQELATAQQKLAALHQQMAENAEQLERVRPSAIALATLTRLQASGVEDIDLLDRMLERGEEWLDHTIQHLEYCEQQGVVGDDYEEWCRHALEDAFDWLDTLHAAGETAPAAPETIASSLSGDDQVSSNQTTEELLLQKLMSEEIEAPEPEDTAPRLAIVQPLTATISTEAGTQAGPSNEALPVESAQEIVGAPFIAPAAGPSTEVGAPFIAPAAAQSTEVGAPFIAPAAAQSTIEPQKQEKTASRRPHFLRRLLVALWR